VTIAAPASIAPPSARQVLLLRAALLPGTGALEAWREWQRGAPVEALEPDSQWLLPLLYCNLRQAGVAGALLCRYANVYRHNWYKNQLLLRATGRVLSGTEPPALLLGGAALAVGYYPWLGARPIERVSIFFTDPSSMTGRLAQTGWLATLDEPPGRMVFVDSLGRRIELVSSLLSPAHQAALLERGRPLRVGGATLRVLSALDQLVLVLVAHAAWDPRSRLFWIADAAQILGRTATSTRAMVLRRAHELNLEHAVAESWSLLCDKYGLAGQERA